MFFAATISPLVDDACGTDVFRSSVVMTLIVRRMTKL
jgi:hypothetical protein